MGNLIDHAKRELEASGLYDPESEYHGAIPADVLALVALFEEQGHSGGSAALVGSLFNRLRRFLPIAPLTGEPHEWCEVAPGVEQNRRCGAVFRENGAAHYLDGIVWREPNGGTYTNRHSRVALTFPCWVPETVVRPASEDPGRAE